MPQPTLFSIAETDLVNEVIAAHPRTISAFNEFGIDACCGGAVSIGEAAERDGAQVTPLLAALRRAAGHTVQHTVPVEEPS